MRVPQSANRPVYERPVRVASGLDRSTRPRSSPGATSTTTTHPGRSRRRHGRRRGVVGRDDAGESRRGEHLERWRTSSTHRTRTRDGRAGTRGRRRGRPRTRGRTARSSRSDASMTTSAATRRRSRRRRLELLLLCGRRARRRSRPRGGDSASRTGASSSDPPRRASRASDAPITPARGTSRRPEPASSGRGGSAPTLGGRDPVVVADSARGSPALASLGEPPRRPPRHARRTRLRRPPVRRSRRPTDRACRRRSVATRHGVARAGRPPPCRHLLASGIRDAPHRRRSASGRRARPPRADPMRPVSRSPPSGTEPCQAFRRGRRAAHSGRRGLAAPIDVGTAPVLRTATPADQESERERDEEHQHAVDALPAGSSRCCR